MQQLERFQPRTHRFFRIMVPWYVSKNSSHIFPIFPCLLLESHSLLYSSSYLSSSMETAHQLHHHHHHHHRQRSWCPAQEAALVPCIEPTFPNSSSDEIIMKERERAVVPFFFLYVFRVANTYNEYPLLTSSSLCLSLSLFSCFNKCASSSSSSSLDYWKHI